MDDATVTLRTKVLQLFGKAALGGYDVEDFVPMEDGHAGHTFGIDLRDPSGNVTQHILKLGPAGVPRQGSADIFRQSKLLKALHAQGLPVPAIDWASAGEEELGAPFIVMRRLPGRSLIVWDPHPSFMRAADLSDLWLSGVRALADFHRLPFRLYLADWEQPTSLSRELERWTSLIRHSEDPINRALLQKLGEALRAAMPPDGPIGLVHGDFQPGNILYDGNRVSGVIDWDLAMIGPQGIDIGWYMMMAASSCWDPAWRPVLSPSKEALVQAYADAGGVALDDIDWFQAFAHFRFGAIAGLNLKLHRSGRRVDDVWEKFALSVRPLVDAGFDILHHKDAAQ